MSKHRKIGPEKTPHLDTFHTVRQSITIAKFEFWWNVGCFNQGNYSPKNLDSLMVEVYGPKCASSMLDQNA